MGRRKKEPRNVHRETIAAAAQILFSRKGIEAASMDDIAAEAGYSKATLYVYFKNKQEIISVLVLESMKKLDAYISFALEKERSTRQRYDLICKALTRYQEEFPSYFKMVLEEINIDFENSEYLQEEEETYCIGERINEKLRIFLAEGIKTGELRADIDIMASIFSFWGMLSGVIQTAVNKEAYITKNLELSRQDFLQYGFDTLYRAIENTDAKKKNGNNRGWSSYER